MSQYIQFFIRSTDKLLPIYTSSRSSSVYHFYHDYAPYGKVHAIPMEFLQRIRDEIRTQISDCNKRLEENRNNLQLITSFNNSVDEKIEALESVREDIHENEESIEEMRKTLHFTEFLMNIYEEAEDTKYYEDKGAEIDPNKYIYFGVECDYPSIAEIEEWENTEKPKNS